MRRNLIVAISLFCALGLFPVVARADEPDLAEPVDLAESEVQLEPSEVEPEAGELVLEEGSQEEGLSQGEDSLAEDTQEGEAVSDLADVQGVAQDESFEAVDSIEADEADAEDESVEMLVPEQELSSRSSDGWVDERDDSGEAVRRYYRNGSWVSGLQSIDGSEYCFDEQTGDLVCGKAQKVDDSLLLFGEDGVRIAGSGWKKVSGKYFWLADNSVLVGWLKDAGSWYYLDKADGTMRESEVFTADGKAYLAGASGACPAASWAQLAGAWYLADSSCALRSGWAKTGGSWYYLDPETYIMKESEFFDVNGTTYVAKENGVCPANGWVKMDDKWYYTNGSCAVQTGWTYTKGAWYYLDPETKAMKEAELFEVRGVTYVAKENGVCPANGWVKLNGKWYYTNGSCAVRSGWAQSGKTWYYLDPKTYVMKVSEAFVLGGKTYIANDSGACLSNAWVKLAKDWFLTDANCAARTGWAYTGGAWYYLDPSADSQGVKGRMRTGLLELGNKSYFLKSSGAMAAAEFVKVGDGTERYADASGVLGMYHKDGVYYNPDGSIVTGWLKLDSKWYYIDPQTNKMAKGWLKDKGLWYWLDSSGVMVTGRKTVDGAVYLFADSGEMVKSGWQNPAKYPQVSSKSVKLPSYATGYHTYVTPSRIAVNATRADCIEAFIGRAYDYLGTPFVEPWSQAPGVGVDCSGLVLQCLYATGMDLEHAAGTSSVGGYNPYNHYYVPAQTYNSMRWYENDTFMPVSVNSIQRGDLVYYNGHVAIYLGGGQIIHSTSATGNVCISDVDIWPVIGAQRPFV